ncbi:MAG: hypothetical protein MUE41_11025 [Gemmatimonadaceae bacterium]|nr:hypothetical protein [Gemmatimonadaceae bacterium]
MASVFRKLFPETIFPRKLSAEAEQRLMLAKARAEEAIVQAHVDNALAFVAALEKEVPFDRAIDIYVRVMTIPDPLASVIATRALVVLGEAFEPRAGAEAPAVPSAEGVRLPAIRIDESADARRG